MALFSEGVVHRGVESVQLGLRLHGQGLPMLRGQRHGELRREVVVNLVNGFLSQELVIGTTVTKLFIQLQIEGRFPAQLLGVKGGREIQQIFFMATKDGVLPIIIAKPDPLLIVMSSALITGRPTSVGVSPERTNTRPSR